MARLWTFLWTLVIYTCKGNGCIFPSDLRGAWHSAQKGVLTFTDTLIQTYPIYLATNVTSTDWVCHQHNDSRYILKGNFTFKVFGKDQRPYLCVDFTQISKDVFIYYIGTKTEVSNNDRIFVREDTVSVTGSDVCNRPLPWEPGTFVTLVRQDANVTSFSRTCPDVLLRKFQNVSLIASDNSVRCDNVTMDTCTNTTVVSVDHQSCPATLKFSYAGDSVCVYDVTEGNTTYISLWNLDETLTASQTHRATCYAVTEEQMTEITYATEFPGTCQPDQTSQHVTLEGVKLTLRDVTENCVPVADKETGNSDVSLASVIGIATGCVTAIVAVIVLCCAFKVNKRTAVTKVIIVQENKTGLSGDINAAKSNETADKQNYFNQSETRSRGCSNRPKHISTRVDSPRSCDTTPRGRKPNIGRSMVSLVSSSEDLENDFMDKLKRNNVTSQAENVTSPTLVEREIKPFDIKTTEVGYLEKPRINVLMERSERDRSQSNRTVSHQTPDNRGAEPTALHRKGNDHEYTSTSFPVNSNEANRSTVQSLRDNMPSSQTYDRKVLAENPGGEKQEECSYHDLAISATDSYKLMLRSMKNKESRIEPTSKQHMTNTGTFSNSEDEKVQRSDALRIGIKHIEFPKDSLSVNVHSVDVATSPIIFSDEQKSSAFSFKHSPVRTSDKYWESQLVPKENNVSVDDSRQNGHFSMSSEKQSSMRSIRSGLGRTTLTSLAAIPKVISGYEMALYNPPNISLNTDKRRDKRFWESTKRDQIWYTTTVNKPRYWNNVYRGSSTTFDRFKTGARRVLPWR